MGSSSLGYLQEVNLNDSNAISQYFTVIPSIKKQIMIEIYCLLLFLFFQGVNFRFFLNLNNQFFNIENFAYFILGYDIRKKNPI